MDKGNLKTIRKRLGLVFVTDEQWIGGTYYTLNLVHALNQISEKQKPEIIVFSNLNDFLNLLSETRYPYLVFEDFSKAEYNQFEKFVNKVTLNLLGFRIFRKKFTKPIDALFIIQRSEYLESISDEKRIYWIPDFQDKYYPQFFTEEGLRSKHHKSLWIHENATKLLVSSNAVKKDWDRFYPNFKGKTSVVHFAVTHPEFDSLDLIELRRKHNLPQEYFFAPNQFWAHKNHLVLIKAAEELKRQGTPVVVVFSGKENDNRNPGYTESLKKYVADNSLEDVVRFLGFLDRREQLKLMKHAVAVVQPSLFEGWSTVIEDAMALNQIVIASDLDVNIEQLGESGIFFEKNSYIDLVSKIIAVSAVKNDFRYSERRAKFGFDLLNVIGFD